MATWEWQDAKGLWKAFKTADMTILEREFKAADKKASKVMEISLGKSGKCELNFELWTHKLVRTGKVKSIRRSANDASLRSAAPPVSEARTSRGVKRKAADCPTKQLLDVSKNDDKTTPTSSVWKHDSKIPDSPPLSSEMIQKQKALGAQSMRGAVLPIDFGPNVNIDPHAKRCFEKMLELEQQKCGEWAVFYHSYSHAALLYELQAAIAAVLFRFKSTYASLPRLMRGCFSEIPDAPSMMKEFPTWRDQDHNPRFKSVGICATTSCLAEDSEAPPKKVFLSGYNIGALSSKMVVDMLSDCGLPKTQATDLATSLIASAGKNGLNVAAYGGKASQSGRAGHLLQIFMRRELVDKYAYAALPMGVPDNSRHPLGAYLNTAGNPHIQGQARIVVHPSAFLQASKVQMYVYSADPTFHSKRCAFQEEITALLAPVLGTPGNRTRAAQAIFGGTLPAWFRPDDQRLVATPAAKVARCS